MNSRKDKSGMDSITKVNTSPSSADVNDIFSAKRDSEYMDLVKQYRADNSEETLDKNQKAEITINEIHPN